MTFLRRGTYLRHLSGTRLLPIALLLFLTAPLSAATRVWSGSGVLWSDPASWGGAVPVAGDDLVFPQLTAVQSAGNDLAEGTMFRSLTFLGGRYVVAGAAIVLGSGGIVLPDGGGDGDIQYELATTLATSQRWQVSNAAGTRRLVPPENVDLAGHTLTLQLSAPIELSINAFRTALGSVTLEGVNGSVFIFNLGASGGLEKAPVRVSGGRLRVLYGYNGPITIGAGAQLEPNLYGGVILGALTIERGGAYVAPIDADFRGPVHIDGAQLAVPTRVREWWTPVTTAVLRIEGSDPAVGTFAGLPEGAIVASTSATVTEGAQLYQVSYHGGDGNDIALTYSGVAPPPAVPALGDGALVILGVAIALAGAMAMRP